MFVRAAAATVFAVVALGGAIWFAAGFLDRVGGEDPEVVLARTADAWLAAVTAGDHAGARALLATDDPAVETVHETLFSLSDDPPRATRAPFVLGDRVASTTVEWELDLRDADTMTWTGTLDLQRDGDAWQVVWEPSDLHPQMRAHLAVQVETTPTVRAPILGADDAVLAGTGARYEVGIEPRRIEDPAAVVAAFEAHVPQAAEDVRELLARDDLRPSWWYPVVELRAGEFEAVWPQLRPVPGVLRREYAQGRVSPTEGFARHLIGRYAEITAEKLEEFEGLYAPGDLIGLSGLEARFEDELVGAPRLEVHLVEPDGDVAATIHEHNGDPPRPVRTSLDVAVQEAIENALVGVEDTAAIVAVDGTTGAVLGSASRPLGGFNRAWAGRYPPGSVAKTVVLVAALDNGWQLDDRVACPGEVVVGGLRLSNAGGRDLGEVTLETAFAASCNTTFARLATELPDGAVALWTDRLGFGADWSHLPFDATSGQWPAPADTAERAAQGIGQGRVLASPLQVAAMMAALDGGRAVTPWLLEPTEPAAFGWNADLLARTRTALRSVVTTGTGTAAAVPGKDVLGKTGTAQVAGEADHAWFAGMHDGIGFAVLVEHGGSGGSVAAPIAARFVRELGDLRAAAAAVALEPTP